MRPKAVLCLLLIAQVLVRAPTWQGIHLLTLRQPPSDFPIFPKISRYINRNGSEMVRAGSDERTFGEEFWMNEDPGISMTTSDLKKMAEICGLLLIHILLPSVSALQRTTSSRCHPTKTTCRTYDIHDVSSFYCQKCCRTRIAWGTTHNSYIYTCYKFQPIFSAIFSGLWYTYFVSSDSAPLRQTENANRERMPFTGNARSVLTRERTEEHGSWCCEPMRTRKRRRLA